MNRRPVIDRYCPSCAVRLARDNTDVYCSVCQKKAHQAMLRPPVVPVDFWETGLMRDALASRHMGKVIAAYRNHPFHVRPLPQRVVGGWVRITQAQLSRLEKGPPIKHLDKLTLWAQTLGIPEQKLWFKLPEQRPVAPHDDQHTSASLTLPGACGDFDQGSFAVVSHKFIPAYLGAETVRRLSAEPSFHRFPHDWLECHATAIGNETEPPCRLYVFACGVAVFHVCEEVEFSSVTSLAAWRWRSYRSALDWTSGRLSDLLDPIGGEEVRSEYVLSLYWLQRPAWDGSDLDTAMRLISVPSVLISQEPSGHIQETDATEQSIFLDGLCHPDLVPFGVQGVSLGYASWSGVSYHPLAADRALSIDDLVSCELTVQAMWCYSHRILAEVEDGHDPTVPAEYGWRFMRAAHSRLAAARPQETSQHRLMREAILSTSGLNERLRAAQEVLRESELVGVRMAT